jgi:hypothetical protein
MSRGVWIGNRIYWTQLQLQLQLQSTVWVLPIYILLDFTAERI